MPDMDLIPVLRTPAMEYGIINQVIGTVHWCHWCSRLSQWWQSGAQWDMTRFCCCQNNPFLILASLDGFKESSSLRLPRYRPPLLMAS